MLKTAGVNNVEDFYKLHPTEEHFFKTYPHMKEKMKKKIRRPKAAMGGYYQNGGQNNQQAQMQKLMQVIAQAFQQGATPEEIIKSLVKQGVSQEAAIQMLKMVVDQSEQGGADEQSQSLPQEGMQEGAQQTYAQGGSLPKEVLRSRLESHMSPSEAQEYLDEYAKGGIHINPAKKGTFTAQATRMGMGVQEAARHILANKDRYSPKMVKKANFARNASKWKHEDGGYTMPGYETGGQTGYKVAVPGSYHPYTPQEKQAAFDSLMHGSTMHPNVRQGSGYMVPAPMPSHSTNNIPPASRTAVSRAYGGYSYQEGGETMPQEQMEGAPQQMQEQAMGQEQQQGGQDQMMQQLAQMVAQALQQGMDPQQIVQMLVQQGVPQEVATQVVQMVMQQMGSGAPQGGPGQQYQPQGGQYQGPQSMQQGQPQAAYGGHYANGGFFNESYMPFDY